MTESNSAETSSEIDVQAIDPEEPALQRRGDVRKCPVCGSPVDAEAYHCPQCRNSFCYHCRAQIHPAEKHLQCTNQDCRYYAKLICEVCHKVTEKSEPPAVYMEPEEGYWPGLLLLALLTGLLTWVWASFLWATWLTLLVFAGGGFLLHRLGINIFGSVRRVEHPRKSRFHPCICCGQRVKQVSTEVGHEA